MTADEAYQNSIPRSTRAERETANTILIEIRKAVESHCDTHAQNLAQVYRVLTEAIAARQLKVVEGAPLEARLESTTDSDMILRMEISALREVIEERIPKPNIPGCGNPEPSDGLTIHATT